MDARCTALDVLEKVAGGAYADHALDAVFRKQLKLDPRDRGLATELVYGVLRHQNRLDHILKGYCKTPLKKLERKVLLLLRIGVYQLLELDRIPAPIAVHETVALARRIRLDRATGLINAILRRVVREQVTLSWPEAEKRPVEHLTWALSLPAWLAKTWYAELGEESFSLAKSLLQPAPFTLRVNRLKSTRKDYLVQLSRSGHHGEATRYAPEGVVITERGPNPLPGDREGLYQVQDEASMLIAHLVDPQPGENILDVCAAPGGKTTHMAVLANNQITIEAFDLHPHRVKLIERGAERLGCSGIRSRVADMLQPPGELREENFDAILLDAPCSGLGVLRRNPEARWRLQPGDITDLAARQGKLLDQAAGLLKSGGRLVYSVCTMTPAETTQVVDGFLARHAEFRLEPLGELVPEAWQDLIADDGALRTWPHRQGMDGFYAVRMIKG